jgi:hypothetical protein
MLCVALASAQEKKPGAEPKKPDAPRKEEAKKPAAPQGDKPADAKGRPEMTPAQEEMMKKWMEYATPGEGHKKLEPMVGKWDYEVRMWMDPQQPEPEISKGTCEMKWILDGHYVQQECTGPAEGPDGKPFRGLGLHGYDNMRKEYFGLWMDNMGTGLLMGYGKCDETGKVINTTGEVADPMTGNLHQKYHAVTKWESNDKFSYTYSLINPDGKEFKEMEITYTRAK